MDWGSPATLGLADNLWSDEGWLRGRLHLEMSFCSGIPNSCGAPGDDIRYKGHPQFCSHQYHIPNSQSNILQFCVALSRLLPFTILLVLA
jgi:hypothetical protein